MNAAPAEAAGCTFTAFAPTKSSTTITGTLKLECTGSIGGNMWIDLYRNRWYGSEAVARNTSIRVPAGSSSQLYRVWYNCAGTGTYSYGVDGVAWVQFYSSTGAKITREYKVDSGAVSRFTC
jgi:hypothetical protein